MNDVPSKTERIRQAVADNLRYALSGRFLRHTGPAPAKSCPVPADFFGICVAAAPDPSGDDLIVAALKDLGLSRVRIDLSYASLERPDAERLLERLLTESFSVCLHPVQPPAEAARLASPESQAAWRAFISRILDRYGARIDCLEIGSTCNRQKWTRASIFEFPVLWAIAREEAQRRHVRVMGPNVTDFEPVYNLALLGTLRRRGQLPGLHSDNLFVERATEPETYDHKILGRQAAGLLKLNLVRKAQLLQDIGQWSGVPLTVCTHVSWSLRRIARFLDDSEGKQADYVARYACLAAASGALARLYWGPLIGQREGLIDDGTDQFPDLFHVTFYGQANGALSQWRRRPAFSAYQAAIQWLAGATFKRALPTGPNLFIFEFEKPGTRIHVAWTTNGYRALTRDCYPDPSLRAEARCYSRDGQRLDQPPATIGESPVYWIWTLPPAQPGACGSGKADMAPPAAAKAARMPQVLSRLRFANTLATHADAAVSTRFLALTFDRFDEGAPGTDSATCTGMFLTEWNGQRLDGRQLLDLCRQSPVNGSMMRDARNQVWTVSAPWNPALQLVIKRFAIRQGQRTILDMGKPDKAVRSWNGAHELLRRGIATPLPLAFFHRCHAPAYAPCYFVCLSHAPCLSARDALTAFSRGATDFQGLDISVFYDALSTFLRCLHDRGVLFRDLSAGNVLFKIRAPGRPEFSLIDTARVRLFPRPLTAGERLQDLKRLCHPLDGQNQVTFLARYMQQAGFELRAWMQAPFALYNAKHKVKRWIKPLREFSFRRPEPPRKTGSNCRK